MQTQRSRVFQGTAADNDGDFDVRDWTLFLGISLIWGSSFLLMAEALEGFTPGLITLGRAGLGAIVLWIMRVRLRPGHRIDRGDRSKVALLGVVWVALPFTLFPIAQQWINSAVTGLLNGATPMLVTVVSVLLVRVRPTSRQLVGLAVGFAGILLISLGAAGEGSSQAGGVLLVLGATTCYGFALNMAPPLQARYGAIVLMSNVMTVATIVVLPYALVDIGANHWDPTAALALLAVGCVGTGFAYWIMTTLVGRVGSIRASFITYLIPVVSLLLGVLLRNDEVTALALVGTPVTIVGAVLAGRRAT